MTISDLVSRADERGVELSARVSPATARKGHFRVWFRFPAEVGPIPAWGDPFLAGFVIPCMYAAEDLHVDAPVSRRLLESVSAIQRLICRWYPEFRQISTTSRETHERIEPTDPLGTATFFSGGVDSAYSLLKHRAEIKELILVHGFENPVGDEDLWEMTRGAVASVAQAFGKTLVTAHTNLRASADQSTAPWGRRYRGSFFGFCYQGSILAAVGLCLQERFSRVIIPSSYTHNTLVPYGSHPLLDPLWSTETLDFVHDGCETSRFGKIRRITAEAPLAVGNLQVCDVNLPGEHNCCRCDKCLRTMIALRLCGALQEADTFHRALDLRRVRRIGDYRRWRADYDELLREARSSGEADLVDALAGVLGERFSLDHLWAGIRHVLGRRALRQAPWLLSWIHGKRIRSW